MIKNAKIHYDDFAENYGKFRALNLDIENAVKYRKFGTRPIRGFERVNLILRFGDVWTSR